MYFNFNYVFGLLHEFWNKHVLSCKADGTNILAKTGSNINIHLNSCFCPILSILQLSFGYCQRLKEMYLDVKK